MSDPTSRPKRSDVEALETLIANALSTHAQHMDPLFIGAITMDLLDRQSLSTLAELVAIRIESRAYQAFQMDMAATFADALDGQWIRFTDEVSRNLEGMADRRLSPVADLDTPTEDEG